MFKSIEKEFNSGDAIVSLIAGGFFLMCSPDDFFAKSQVDGWILALLLFGFSILGGFISAFVWHKKNDFSITDPFYRRAISWGGACLVLIMFTVFFRPLATIMAFIIFSLNAGAVVGYRIYRKYHKYLGS